MNKSKKHTKDAQQDRRLAKVERMVNQIEIKMAEPWLIGLTAMTLVPTWRSITSIAQGITKFTRIGNKTQPIELFIDWMLQNTDPAITLNARCLLVRLRRANALAVPSDAELLNDPSGAVSVFSALGYNGAVKYNNRGFNNEGPIEVLHDSGVITLHPVNVANGTIDQRYQYNLRKRVKCNLKYQATYNGVNIADNVDGHYYLITWATGVAAFERGSLAFSFADS